MELKAPIEITPRLLPGVRVGNVFIAIEYGKPTPKSIAEGRRTYQVTIDGVGKTYIDRNLRSGVGRGSLQQGLSDFLYWLTVANDGEPDHKKLFPKRIVEWARENEDELRELAHQVEDTPGLIKE